MIVWGGADPGNFNDGGRYNPPNNSWTAVTSPVRLPRASSHTAVWTGSEMIVWGGDQRQRLERRRALQSVDQHLDRRDHRRAPAARQRHTAVWTGTR